MALAQLMFVRGRRTELVVGLDQLSTRMYTSLGEIVAGWGKNIYVASFDVVPHHPAARALIPMLLIAPACWTLLPVLGLLGALLGLASPAVALWAALCVGAMLIWWAVVYWRVLRLSPAYALTFPLAAVVVLYIVSGSIARGRRVSGKVAATKRPSELRRPHSGAGRPEPRRRRRFHPAPRIGVERIGRHELAHASVLGPRLGRVAHRSQRRGEREMRPCGGGIDLGE